MKTKREASVMIALLPILILAVIMGVGFGVYRYSVEVLLLISSFITIAITMLYGTTWQQISDAITEKVSKAFMAIFIFVFVGMIIGSWILSGTIPMLIYYGLKLLSPSLFLVTAFIICCIVSVCTGTSFGCVGTIGLALIGVASGLGINLAAAAGAIVSGAYFGDKMSPISDTNNLAPVAAGSPLFPHIAYLFYTTIPSILISLVVYFIAGQSSSIVSDIDGNIALDMMSGLENLFEFNVLLLIPLIVVLVGAIRGMPTIPVMFSAVVISWILAMIFQGNTIGDCITAAFSGFNMNMSGIEEMEIGENIRDLVVRGGMTSMTTTILKVLCAFVFAGAMTASGFIEIILNKLKSFVHSDGTLVLVAVISTIIVTIVVGNAYVPLLLCGELFAEAFKERKLHAKNLSRILQDSGSIILPLIPWSAAGAYVSSTLGVSTVEYLPWAVFCYTGTLIVLFYGFTGIKVAKISENK